MIHVVRRGLILIALGIIYNNGLFQINDRNLLLRFRLREPNNSPNDHYDKQKSQHTLALNWQKRLALYFPCFPLRGAALRPSVWPHI